MKVLEKIKELEDLMNDFKKKTSILFQQAILKDTYYNDLEEAKSQADKIVNDAGLFNTSNTETLLSYNKFFNFEFKLYSLRSI